MRMFTLLFILMSSCVWGQSYIPETHPVTLFYDLSSEVALLMGSDKEPVTLEYGTSNLKYPKCAETRFTIGDLVQQAVPLFPEQEKNTRYRFGYAKIYYPQGLSGVKFYSPSLGIYSRGYGYLRTHSGLLDDASDYKQRDAAWSKEPYGSGNTTIGKKGCALTSACNMIRDTVGIRGVNFTPSQLNKILKERKLYVGNLIVHQEIVKVVNEKLKAVNSPYRLIYKPWLGVKAALLRRIPVMCSVKDSGHWVYVVMHERPGSFRIHDPSDLTDSLGDYWGANLKNTRSYFEVNILEKDLQIEDETDQVLSVSVGNSSIFAYSMDKVNLQLYKDSNLVIDGQDEYLYDIDTEERTYEGTTLDYAPAIPGEYRLRVRGNIGDKYDVTIWCYDENLNKTEYCLTGVFNGQEVNYLFVHKAVLYIPNIKDVYTNVIGSQVVIVDGVVTAVTPKGFFIQSSDKPYIPGVFVKYIKASTINRGDSVGSISGYIEEYNEVRYVNAQDVYTYPLEKDIPSYICNINAVKSSRNLFVKLTGRIINGKLDNIIPVKNLSYYADGSLIWVEGVYTLDNEFCCVNSGYLE